jgi:hypothetical protein
MRGARGTSPAHVGLKTGYGGPALCSKDFHGDIAVAKASAQTGVPMVASTLTQDRMEEVAPTGRVVF